MSHPIPGHDYIEPTLEGEPDLKDVDGVDFDTHSDVELSNKDKEDDSVYDCEYCQDEGLIEIIGDGNNFECDVIGYKRCPYCN